MFDWVWFLKLFAGKLLAVGSTTCFNINRLTWLLEDGATVGALVVVDLIAYQLSAIKEIVKGYIKEGSDSYVPFSIFVDMLTGFIAYVGCGALEDRVTAILLPP